jgi:hypothetical protein
MKNNSLHSFSWRNKPLELAVEAMVMDRYTYLERRLASINIPRYSHGKLQHIYTDPQFSR